MNLCSICTNKSTAAEGLSSVELQELGHKCNPVTFQRGDRIMIQNSLSYNIVFIKDGLVKVHVMGPDRELILRIAKGPCFLGISTTLGANINQYSATALLPTDVCFISAEIFKDFIGQNGHFAFEIILELCKNELHNFQKCINQFQKQGAGKIADALLQFSEYVFEKEEFQLPLTRTELGDLTNTSRETVSRVLNDFAHYGIIHLDKKHLVILNKEKLKHISETG